MLRGCALARSDRHLTRNLTVLGEFLSKSTNRHCFSQEFTPTRDNVIFLIDVQHSMFQEAGLKDTEVRLDCSAHSLLPVGDLS